MELDKPPPTASSNVSREFGHYVVTSHKPGSTLVSCKCSFTASDAIDLIVVKSNRIEVRTLSSTTESSLLPLTVDVPIRGRITSLIPFLPPNGRTSHLFVLTSTCHYTVLSYDPNGLTTGTNRIRTHDTGCVSDVGRPADCGPLLCLVEDNGGRKALCLHLYQGSLTLLPIGAAPPGRKGGSSVLGHPSSVRLNELNTSTILNMMPIGSQGEVAGNSGGNLVVLYRDLRQKSHVMTLALHGAGGAVSAPGPRRSRIDAGSGLLLLVPPLRSSVAAAASATSSAGPPTLSGGGVLILGQNQITYLPSTPNAPPKILPMQETLLLSAASIPTLDSSDIRYLLGDDTGRLLVLALLRNSGGITSMTLDYLGSVTTPTGLTYLDDGLVFVGSQFGDSQLIQIHPSDPFVEIREEFLNLGPIVDFDVLVDSGGTTGGSSGVQSAGMGQCQIVAACGCGKDGTVRVIRNGIGIHEQANVDIAGIKGMWNLRPSYSSPHDKYLIQSFISEARILSINHDEMSEITIPGIISTDETTLFCLNICPGDCIVQITDRRVSVIDCKTLRVVQTWMPSSQLDCGGITVANGNASGQIVVALRGGTLAYLQIRKHDDEDDDEDGGGVELEEIHITKLEQEVSCIDLTPFDTSTNSSSYYDNNKADSVMDIDSNSTPPRSKFVALGLWNDYTVRILSLENKKATSSINDNEATISDAPLDELLKIELGGDTQARSILMSTLQTNRDMLLIGLGDGNLISYAVNQDYIDSSFSGITTTKMTVSVSERKKVSLGSQSVSLCTFQKHLPAQEISNAAASSSKFHTCVFASCDRPTIVYMSGNGKKMLYSNINLNNCTSSIPSIENSCGTPEEEVINHVTPFHCELFPDCLCFASESTLRIGIIDDIQKLHVQTFRLNECPIKIACHADGNLFIVGCVSGQGNEDEDHSIIGDMSAGNVVRFLTNTFDEIHRVDLDPFETITSLVSCRLVNRATNTTSSDSSASMYTSHSGSRPYIIVGTAYAIPNEDEPSMGRLLVFETTNLVTNRSNDGGEMDSGGGTLNTTVRQITQLVTRGAVYSICPFLDGSILATVNSRTNLYHLHDVDNVYELQADRAYHHGHVLSLCVKSLDNTAIVGDLMRSVSVLDYIQADGTNTLREVSRDFNPNFTTAIEILSPHVFLGSETFNNIFSLQRNVNAATEEGRCRLENKGEYYLGEMVNKFVRGSLVGDNTNSSMDIASVVLGSRTLYATVDGSIGSVLGMDRATFVFFNTLQHSIVHTIPAVGGLDHGHFRSFKAERRSHPCRGFVDGDLIESFLDLTPSQMKSVVDRMNSNGGWKLSSTDDGEEEEAKNIQDRKVMGSKSESSSIANMKNLSVESVLAKVEEMSRQH